MCNGDHTSQLLGLLWFTEFMYVYKWTLLGPDVARWESLWFILWCFMHKFGGWTVDKWEKSARNFLFGSYQKIEKCLHIIFRVFFVNVFTMLQYTHHVYIVYTNQIIILYLYTHDWSSIIENYLLSIIYRNHHGVYWESLLVTTPDKSSQQ